MNTKKGSLCFEDEFLKLVGESDVWKKLSASEVVNWSESLMDKYADHWDWRLLSENTSIPWTEGMLQKYKSRIHWERLPSTLVNCFLHQNRMKYSNSGNGDELDISSLLSKLLLGMKCQNTLKHNECMQALTSRGIHSQRDVLLKQLGLAPLASLEDVLEAAKERYNS